MRNEFKTFWGDYNNMCLKPQMKWMKKHWKGYILMLVASFSVGYTIGVVLEKKDDIIDSVKSKFHKGEES